MSPLRPDPSRESNSNHDQDAHLDESSVTQWFHRMQDSGEDDEQEEALRKIWGRYFEKLVTLANRTLGDRPRRVADEEDAASYVLQALYEGARSGRFRNVRDRQDLWKLLVCLTRGQVHSQLRYINRKRRGGGEVRGESVFLRDSDFCGLDELASEEPDAEFLVRMNERITQLLGALRSDTFRQLVLWKLEGLSNEEIAGKLDISQRTVERKLNLIRHDWTRMIES